MDQSHLGTALPFWASASLDVAVSNLQVFEPVDQARISDRPVMTSILAVSLSLALSRGDRGSFLPGVGERLSHSAMSSRTRKDLGSRTHRGGVGTFRAPTKDGPQSFERFSGTSKCVGYQHCAARQKGHQGSACIYVHTHMNTTRANLSGASRRLGGWAIHSFIYTQGGHCSCDFARKEPAPCMLFGSRLCSSAGT